MKNTPDSQGVPAGPAQALTFREVSERLAISEATLFRLIADEALPSVKIGRARRFLAEDVDSYLRGLRTPKST